MLFSKKDLQETVINIKGMHCEMCTKRMCTAFRDTKGIAEANVTLDGEMGSAAIKYDANKLSLSDLKNIVTETGYTPI